MKYINNKTGRIFEDDNEVYVMKLIETKDYFSLYEESVIKEEKIELDGIEAYIPTKPRKKKYTK